MIDGFATEPHYLDHLLPVVEACGGRMLCGSNALLDRARQLAPSVEAIPGVPRKPDGPPVLVAGFRDAQRVNRHRRLGLLEHGAGQTYIDALADPHYAGGLGWQDCALILTPGPHAASFWRPRVEGTSTAVVELHGTPRLDRYTCPDDCDGNGSLVGDSLCGRDGGTGGTAGKAREAVGVSFHWDCRVCPESRATWREWWPAVRVLAEQRQVLATAHPRAWRLLSGAYRRDGIPATSEFTDLVESCWLFVCDNSSTMYEWAGLGRPVLALNGRAYRTDGTGHHGLRFYDSVPGPMLWPRAPHDLALAVDAMARDDCAEALEFAAVACEAAYGLPRFDGQATARAVAAIKEHLA